MLTEKLQVMLEAILNRPVEVELFSLDYGYLVHISIKHSGREHQAQFFVVNPSWLYESSYIQQQLHTVITQLVIEITKHHFVL